MRLHAHGRREKKPRQTAAQTLWKMIDGLSSNNDELSKRVIHSHVIYVENKFAIALSSVENSMMNFRAKLFRPTRTLQSLTKILNFLPLFIFLCIFARRRIGSLESRTYTYTRARFNRTGKCSLQEPGGSCTRGISLARRWPCTKERELLECWAMSFNCIHCPTKRRLALLVDRGNAVCSYSAGHTPPFSAPAGGSGESSDVVWTSGGLTEIFARR